MEAKQEGRMEITGKVQAVSTSGMLCYVKAASDKGRIVCDSTHMTAGVVRVIGTESRTVGGEEGPGERGMEVSV